jgi:phosphoribosylglycinamide formyltransferase-1
MESGGIMLRLAVLISGRGSNLQSLIAYTAQDVVPARIVKVLADTSAAGLTLAEAAGIPAEIIDHSLYPDRQSFEHILAEAIETAKVDLICLAGFMRVLSPSFCRRYDGKIINIHPSLLPDYKGLNTHQRALNDGAKHHGCSVHVVTAELDDGPIITQHHVEVKANDDQDTLAARVLTEEHKIYPAVIGAFAANLITITSDQGQVHLHQKSGAIPGHIPGMEHQMQWPLAST